MPIPEWITVHLERLPEGNRVLIEDTVYGLRECDLKASLKFWNHSPTGFEWGYAGSGAGQTALSILLTCGLGPNESCFHQQRFKFDFVARWDRALEQQKIDIPLGTWLKAEQATERYKARFSLLPWLP